MADPGAAICTDSTPQCEKPAKLPFGAVAETVMTLSCTLLNSAGQELKLPSMSDAGIPARELPAATTYRTPAFFARLTAFEIA